MYFCMKKVQLKGKRVVEGHSVEVLDGMVQSVGDSTIRLWWEDKMSRGRRDV